MINIKAICAFNDNYIWLLLSDQEVWVVDPGDADPVIQTLSELDRSLTGILITHHHFDHTGGVDELRRLYSPRVVGPASSPAENLTEQVRQGDTVTVAGAVFQVIEVPGHTLDHIALVAADHQPPLLFCGDTLFAGGCGRIFEGTAPMMYASLQRLAKLPPQTLVFCAHEYTLANLEFAQAVEPDNTALQARIARDQRLRAQKLPTVPSTLEDELTTNPFLRSDAPAVRAAAQRYQAMNSNDDADTFSRLREWKNNFQPDSVK